MMLHELEDEVHFTNEEPDFQWDDDEDSHNEKKLEDKKSGNAVLTSAQAKLAKELINWPTHTRCRTAYQTWFNKLRTILAMFMETSQLIQGENSIL